MVDPLDEKFKHLTESDRALSRVLVSLNEQCRLLGDAILNLSSQITSLETRIQELEEGYELDD